MNSQEIAVQLNRARVAIELLNRQGFQRQVHTDIPSMGPADVRTLLEEIQTNFGASVEQILEAG